MPNALGRSVASGVTLSLGLLTLTGSLHTLSSDSHEVDFCLACPECGPAQPAKVTTQHVCSKGHGPFDHGDLDRGVEEGVGRNKTVRWVGRGDAVKAARLLSEVDYPKHAVELVSALADEVDAHTFPKGVSYAIVPGAPSALAAVLREMLDVDGSFLGDDGNRRVLLGKIRLRDTVTPVRVQVHRGKLILQGLEWPSRMKEIPAIEGECLAENVEVARRYLEAATTPFNVEAFGNPQLELDEKIAAVGVDAFEPEVSVAVATKDEDLFAALAASLPQRSAPAKAKRTRKPKEA